MNFYIHDLTIQTTRSQKIWRHGQNKYYQFHIHKRKNFKKKKLKLLISMAPKHPSCYAKENYAHLSVIVILIYWLDFSSYLWFTQKFPKIHASHVKFIWSPTFFMVFFIIQKNIQNLNLIYWVENICKWILLVNIIFLTLVYFLVMWFNILLCIYLEFIMLTNYKKTKNKPKQNPIQNPSL